MRLVGRFRGFETTKSGGLRVNLVPSKFGFQPRSPRYGPFLVLGLFVTNNAHLDHFWPFLGRFSDISWS